MAFMDNIQALAGRMFASDKVTDATITRKTTGSFDRVAGTVTSTEDVIACRAVAAPFKTRNENGATVLKTMLTLDTKVVSGDIVTLGTIEYTVGQVSEIAPHGTAFAWKAVVS